jgi:hypothetical protein
MKGAGLGKRHAREAGMGKEMVEFLSRNFLGSANVGARPVAMMSKRPMDPNPGRTFSESF